LRLHFTSHPIFVNARAIRRFRISRNRAAPTWQVSSKALGLAGQPPNAMIQK